MRIPSKWSKHTLSPQDKVFIGGVFFAVVSLITAFAAWITHVVVCIHTSEYLFLLIGALIAPIGMINGIGVWFGIW